MKSNSNLRSTGKIRQNGSCFGKVPSAGQKPPTTSLEEGDERSEKVSMLRALLKRLLNTNTNMIFLLLCHGTHVCRTPSSTSVFLTESFFHLTSHLLCRPLFFSPLWLSVGLIAKSTDGVWILKSPIFFITSRQSRCRDKVQNSRRHTIAIAY